PFTGSNNKSSKCLKPRLEVSIPSHHASIETSTSATSDNVSSPATGANRTPIMSIRLYPKKESRSKQTQATANRPSLINNTSTSGTPSSHTNNNIARVSDGEGLDS